MHGFHNAKFSQSRMCDLACNQRFGDHANYFAIAGEHSVGDLAHKTNVGAPVNQSQATFNKGHSCVAGSLKVFRTHPGVRSTEDADPRHGCLVLRRSGACLGLCVLRRSAANGVSISWLPITRRRRKFVEPLVVRVPATMPMMSCFSTNLWSRRSFSAERTMLSVAGVCGASTGLTPQSRFTRLQTAGRWLKA